jgi:hypothetical protein
VSSGLKTSVEKSLNWGSVLINMMRTIAEESLNSMGQINSWPSSSYLDGNHMDLVKSSAGVDLNQM